MGEGAEKCKELHVTSSQLGFGFYKKQTSVSVLLKKARPKEFKNFFCWSVFNRALEAIAWEVVSVQLAKQAICSFSKGILSDRHLWQTVEYNVKASGLLQV